VSIGSETKVPTDGLNLPAADTKRNPLAEVLLTGDEKPSILVPTVMVGLPGPSASSTSTLDSMSIEEGSNSHDCFGGDLHVTAEDLEAAVTQCSVVLNVRRRRGGGEQDQCEDLTCLTNGCRVGLSHFVQRLRDKAFDARLID
jgi:hypothetical protein